MTYKTIDSLYLHFPFCRHLCNYCDFFKSVPTDRGQDLGKFHLYLEQSYQVHEKLMHLHGYQFAPLKTFYIGGGTPSLWGNEGVEFLKDFFQRKGLSLDKDCEFTMEVNPGTWTEESLLKWREFGANRFSLGVQSYQSDMLKVLDRVHSLEDVKDILAHFDKWDVNFSVDFMLGLPKSGELKRDVIAELKEVLSYDPDHLSLYILTVKSNYVHSKFLPKEEWIEDEYLKVSEFLLAKNYQHYEVSNFAKPGKKSRHNLSYWESKTVGALGPSATGFLAEDSLRYKWKPHSPAYETEILNVDEAKLEKYYMSLRSDVGLEVPLAQQTDAFRLKLEDWKKRDLVTFKDQRIYLTSKGYLILDSLMNDLFTLKIV
jgi:oxygen-independent coproporphyrinogen III oxidase